MIDISIGAVGAAIIAGLVSLLGLIISKEQKISEFLQAWIDDRRKCLVAYLANINSISDTIRLKNSGEKFDNSNLIASYKALNEANHGITLRVNSSEEPAKAILKSMSEFELIASVNANLTPDKIRSIEQGFIESSKELLKFEWKRVKRGEKIFVWTKIAVSVCIALMLLLLIYIGFKNNSDGKINNDLPIIQIL